jgi:two-component system, NarL family, response regulator LiaR
MVQSVSKGAAPMTIRVLLVDDHSVVRQGLRMFLDLDAELEVIGHLKRESHDTEIIALTSVLEDEKVIGAVKAGAIGYLLKDTQADELIRAIKGAAAGEAQLSRAAAERLMREIHAPAQPEALTDRETDVLRLLAVGQSNKEIARNLGVNESTIKSHVSNILAKLGVQGRTQAALHAVRSGLVPAASLRQ